MKKRLVVAAIVLVGAVVVAGLALHKPHSPLSGEVTNDPALVQRGAYLAIAGDCSACHTAPGGKPYAGGLAMPVPMVGTIHTPNITPDMSTGIGAWSLADFDRAVRYGVDKDGQNLYPAMPYVSYAKVSDEDIKALYAYFKYGVPAINQTEQPNSGSWPMTMRWPLQLWNVAFFDGSRYQDKSGHDATWNRGAYLAQGLAHCGTCHTPRGIAIQEVALDETKTGYLGGSLLGGWQAYNITSDGNAGIGAWSTDQLGQYLATGDLPGVAQAAGPMGEAVEHSFSSLTKADVAAIAAYIKTVPPVTDANARPRQTQGAPSNVVASFRGVSFNNETGEPARIFLGACASCHHWTGSGTPGTHDSYYPSLFHNSTVGSANPDNLAQVILHGIHRKTADRDISMPAFGSTLSDKEVALLVNFLTKQFGADATPMTEQEVRKLR